MKLVMISDLIKAVWDEIDKVFTLSSTKAVIVFGSNEAMVKAISAGVDLVFSFCYSMKPWSSKEWCFSHYVWINLSGVPPFA